MDEIKLRRFELTDWRDFRDIRLEALAKHPTFFSPSRDETKFTEEDWKERINNKNGAVFGLYSGDRIIGLTAIVREKNDPNSTVVHLVSSYIREEFRGRGFSKFFYEARLLWVNRHPDIKTIVVEHRDDNFASRKAHEKFGFRFISSRDVTWPDGTVRPSLRFELAL